MARSGQAYRGKQALELIEESMHALRVCPLPVLACYFIGTLPFVIGFLFFWSEMTRSSYALDRSVGAALGLALLYFWMKLWQSIFCRKLLEQWTPESLVASFPKRRWIRHSCAQCFLQSTALPMQVLGANVIVPFAWIYAFYQNVTVLGFTQDFGVRPTRGLFRMAARQSNHAARQNHALILLIAFFSFFVWVNVYSVLLILPILLKMLTGIESVFTINPFAAYLNTTFFAVTVATAFLCVSPLVKIVYTLRCFYGLSVTTGADLRMRMAYLRNRKRPRARATAILAGVLCATGVMLPAPAAAVEGGGNPAAAVETVPVSGEELDGSIDRVITQSRYLWRLPRTRSATGEGGPVEQFFRKLVEGIRTWLTKIGKAIDDFFDWLRRWLRGRDLSGLDENEDPVDVEWESVMRGGIYVLTILVAMIGLLVAARAIQQRRLRESAEAKAGAVAARVDLESEEILASQLPEDEWMKLAREQIERGELRLAVRALFLASLAFLGERELLLIEKSKSNLDYQRELSRGRRVEEGMLMAFEDNLHIFERSWYGLHEVGADVVEAFRTNYEKITAKV